jgi:4-hydroxy-tetrahydrodipicolinate reductase
LTALALRGVSVVSSCEELAFPWLQHAELAAELDAAARSGGARLLGTGVNPGFVMDALPAFVSGVCASVRALAVWRIQDASTRRVPFQQKIGAGLSLSEFRARAAAKRLRHVGLGESLHFLARALAIPIERWEEELEPVVAERELACTLGPIPAGHAAGVRQVARGYVGNDVRITLEFQAAIGQAAPHDRVRIDGEPPLDVVVKGGIHGDVATTGILCNAIEPLLAAAPGLHTMATIALAACRNFVPRGSA